MGMSSKMSSPLAGSACVRSCTCSAPPQTGLWDAYRGAACDHLAAMRLRRFVATRFTFTLPRHAPRAPTRRVTRNAFSYGLRASSIVRKQSAAVAAHVPAPCSAMTRTERMFSSPLSVAVRNQVSFSDVAPVWFSSLGRPSSPANYPASSATLYNALHHPGAQRDRCADSHM